MNDNFIEIFEHSGMTMYQLSNCSGVPYTTINEICNRKKNINAKASETVFRLAAALGCDVLNIMNPISFLDHVKGIYKGVRYEWIHGKTMALRLTYKGDEHVIETSYQLTNPKDWEAYAILHTIYIDRFLNEIDSAREMELAAESLRLP